MRLWIVNHYALPPTQAGGTRHFSLARHLVRRGHAVTIFASSFNYSTYSDPVFNQPENRKRRWARQVLDEVEFIWLRTPAYRGNTLRRVRNMLSFARTVERQALRWGLDAPDVIIGSSPTLFAARAAQRLAARLRIPFVLEVRDLWPQTFIDFKAFSARHPAMRVLESIERGLYRTADRILTLAPGAHEHIAGKGADPAKIHWLPNGVDLDVVPPPHPPPGRSPLVAMYAGAHGRANALDTVLDAAALLQQSGDDDLVRFRLIGDGPEKPRLVARAAREGLRTVSFEAAVPKQNIHGLLLGADLFLHSTHDTALYRYGISPNKLFDYMAAGRPTIDASPSFRSPIAESGAGITLAAEQPALLADAIRAMCALSPAARGEMGQRGRRFIEERHNFARLAEQLEAILKDVAAAALPRG